MEINDQEDSLISGKIKDINAANFVRDVIEASKKVPIIVDFWAPWCEPCKQLTPLLENAVKDQKEKLILAKINIDQNQEIASQLRIQSIPTVYLFFEGKVVDGFQGAKTNSEILEFVLKSASLSGPGEEVETLISMVKDNIDERKWENAEEIAQKILSLDPENQIGFGSLIRAMIGLAKFSEVKEFISTLTPKIKESKPVLEAISSLAVSEKGYKAKENLEELQNKLEKDPKNLDVLLETSIALFGIGDIETSFDMLLNSIEIDKDWKEQAARKQLIEFFTSIGFQAKETVSARRKLAKLIFS